MQHVQHIDRPIFETFLTLEGYYYDQHLFLNPGNKAFNISDGDTIGVVYSRGHRSSQIFAWGIGVRRHIIQ